MSAGDSNQNGASASSSCQSLDPARGLSLSDGTLVKTHYIADTKEIEFAFAWTIKNFSLRKEEVNRRLECLTYSAGPNHELKWLLYVYPKGMAYEVPKCLGVYLELVHCGQDGAPTQVELSIINDRNEKTHKRRHPEQGEFAIMCEGSTAGYEDWVKLDVLLNKANGLLPQDNLTIFCEGTAILNKIYLVPPPNQPKFNVSKCNLFKDFGSLFENPEFSDFILSVDGKDLPVHKAILAARSSVFAAMFKYDMEEKRQNRATIEDIDYDVLREMLLYIYSGKTQQLKRMARNLLVAADKYNVSGLKETCEMTLYSTITAANAVDLLLLADKYSAKQLKTHVTHFISTHVKDVMQTPAWKNMNLNQLPVLREVCEALAAAALK